MLSEFDFLIISPGGAGSTYLMRYLKTNTDLIFNSVYDHDGLKHLSKHNIDKLNGIKKLKKIVYVINDPVYSIESHFRRGWHSWQFQKLTGKNWKMQQNEYYDHVVKNKKDMFGIEDQFDAIVELATDKDKNIKVLFINFNDVLKEKKKVSSFIGCNVSIFDEFEYEERTIYSLDTNEKYIKIYNKLYKKMNKLNGKIL